MRSRVEAFRERGALLLGTMAALQVATLVVRAAKLGPQQHVLVSGVLVLSLAAGIAAIALSEKLVDRLRAAARFVAATPRRSTLTLLGWTLAVLTVNVFLQQAYAWDEGGVIKVARLVGERGFAGLEEAYRINAWLGPQHPPLAAFIYGGAWALGGTSLLAMRLVAVAFGCGAVMAAYRIGDRLYGRRVGLLMGGLLLTMPILVRVCSAATNDAPVFFFFCLSILCGLRVLETRSDQRAVALGLVVGLGLVTKYTMALVYPVLLVLPFVVSSPSWPWRATVIALAMSLGVLGAWLIVASDMGILVQQSERLTHMATQRSYRFPFRALFVRLPSAVGVFALPMILLGLLRSMRVARRAEAFVLLWLAAVAVPLFITLPLHRFFVPAFPALTAAMALALADRPTIAPRVVLLMAALGVTTLIYYGWVDLSIRL